MRTKRRVLGTAAVVLLLVAAPLRATWSAFSATTADAGNTFAAGTVVLTDDDGGSAMITMSGGKPGDADTSCIQVTTAARSARSSGCPGPPRAPASTPMWT